MTERAWGGPKALQIPEPPSWLTENVSAGRACRPTEAGSTSAVTAAAGRRLVRAGSLS